VPLNQNLRYIGLIGPGVDTSFISPIWSLQVEMRVSLIFPLLFMIMISSQLWFRVLLIAASAVLGLLDPPTIKAIPLFLLGIALAMNEQRIRALSLPRLAIFGTLSLGVALYGIRSMMGLQIDAFSKYASGLGAALIILAVVANPQFAAILRWAPLHFMGRISYSFYLIHLPIMFFVASHFDRPFGLIPSIAIAFFLTLIVAYLMFELVERSGIGLGSKAAKLLTSRRSRPPATKADIG